MAGSRGLRGARLDPDLHRRIDRAAALGHRIEPILGIAAAVTRATIDGKQPGGWVPEQKISAEEALRAYTVTAAYAAFEENLKGSIQPGQLADLVVLAQDPFKIDPSELLKIQVERTMVGGSWKYES